MKIIVSFLVLITSIFAQEFYAKLEPINSYKIKASVSGKVIYSNEKIEGFNAKNSLIIKVDSKVNEIDLKQSLNKSALINSMINIEQKNYNRLKVIKSKPAYEKDSQRLKVINLQSTRADLKVKIETLRDQIKNKKLSEKSNYIYKVHVKKGDYVNPGALLYETKDLSKSKLEFYIPISMVETIKNKVIYLNGKETSLKINKIYKTADENHISSYKVRLVLNDKKNFSRLIKIEFK